jgi:hypothetical protein
VFGVSHRVWELRPASGVRRHIMWLATDWGTISRGASQGRRINNFATFGVCLFAHSVQSSSRGGVNWRAIAWWWFSFSLVVHSIYGRII